MKALRFAWLVTVVLVGCGGEEAERTRAARCDTQQAKVCVDYPRLTDAAYEAAQADCQESQGAWAESACPTESRLGSCVRVEDGVTVESRYYPPLDAQELQQNCTDAGGTYTAG